MCAAVEMDRLVKSHWIVGHGWMDGRDGMDGGRTSELDNEGRLGGVLFGITAGAEEDEHLVLSELVRQDAAGLTTVGHVEEALATAEERRELLLKGVWHRIGQAERWSAAVRGAWCAVSVGGVGRRRNGAGARPGSVRDV